MSKKTKMPEMEFEFSPTTIGVPKFKVHETLITMTKKKPVEVLLNTRSYTDENNYVYTLNDPDVESLAKIFSSFLNECIIWSERRIIENRNKTLTSYCLVMGIVGGNIIGWSIRSGHFAIAIVTFIIGAILTLPLSKGFSNI